MNAVAEGPELQRAEHETRDGGDPISSDDRQPAARSPLRQLRGTAAAAAVDPAVLPVYLTAAVLPGAQWLQRAAAEEEAQRRRQPFCQRRQQRRWESEAEAGWVASGVFRRGLIACRASIQPLCAVSSRDLEAVRAGVS